MPLKTGLWRINANGVQGILDITNPPDANGNVKATLLGTPCQGFWSESEQKLTLTLGSAKGVKVFTGYQFSEHGGVHVYLAGTFEAFAGLGATANHNSFGWRAILG